MRSPPWQSASVRQGLGQRSGLTELITPTNGALMAVITAAGVRYEDWLSFVTPLYGALLGLGAIAIVVAIAIGF
jgi:uncharacterized ion transporter superfamily protein YfcC